MLNPRPYTKLKFGFAALLFIYFIIVVQPWNLYFLNDDFVHIPLSAQTIWIHFSFFRPIANLVTALEVKLYGNNPIGFHITSILLHIAATYLVTLLTNALLTKYGNREKYEHAGFLTGCLFFIYPFHSEPLMWVIGRISIIATLFYLLSILFFINRSARYHHVVSLLFFIPALFTYEISWTLPLVITVLSITDHYKEKKTWRATVRSLLPHWILFGLFLGLRSFLLQRVFTEYDVAGRNLNMVELLTNSFRLVARTLIPPTQNTTLFAGAFLVAIALIISLVIYLIKKKALTTAHMVTGCLLCISYLPVISIGTDTHGTEGERYLYLPSVFWLILLVLLIYTLPTTIRRPLFIVLFTLFANSLANSAKTYQHASHIASQIMKAVNPPTPVKNIVAVNMPANYKGALIYRMGYEEAVRWMRPDITFDSALVIPAVRTFEKIPDTLQVIHFNAEAFTRLPIRKTAGDSLVIDYNGKTLPYFPATDLLIFFPPNQPGLIIYPQQQAP
jgi:hypothetical protein